MCNFKSTNSCVLIIIILILSVGCLAYVVIMFGYELIVVQGYATSGGPSAIVSLFPPLVLFLIGWLIKRRFFADTGRCLKVMYIMIIDLKNVNIYQEGGERKLPS